MTTISPGVQIGPYVIVEQVGRGGMATVFKAYQPGLSRHVAIKVLPEFLAGEPGFAERFQREAVAVASLRHPNIPTVHDYGEQEGIRYISTEFFEGGTLAARLGEPVPLNEVVSLLRPVASALDYAHGRGVVHRDVKPANILMTGDGTPVLTDFGLARMLAADHMLTQTGAVLGTPAYMSPEQCAGEQAGPAADQYALAVVAYELLSGRPPFQSENTMALVQAHLSKPPPPANEINPALPAGLSEALARGLAKDPGSRYATASELIEALAEAPQPARIAASPPALPVKAAGRQAPPRARMGWRAPLAVLTILLLVIGAGAYALSRAGTIALGTHPAVARAAVSSISCPTPASCFAVGSGGAIYATRDGGLTWKNQSSGTRGDLYGVACGDPADCVIVRAAGSVLTTVDAGSTWVSRSVPTTGTLRSVSCPSPSRCVVGGSAGIVVVTADAGATWAARPTSDSAANFNSISCPSVDSCVAAGFGAFGGGRNTPNVVATSDGGATWTVQKGTEATSISGVSCGAPGVCAAVAGTSSVMRTTSAGASWTTVDTGAGSNLQAISCPASAACYAVGAAGTIVATRDGGATWALQRSGTTRHLGSVSCPTTSACVAAGEAGVVLTTTNAGATWTVRP